MEKEGSEIKSQMHLGKTKEKAAIDTEIKMLNEEKAIIQKYIDELTYQIEQNLFVACAILGAGKSFGELALIKN